MSPPSTRGGVRPAPLTAGPRWYKKRIRTLGPLFGTIPMIVLGGISLLSLAVFDGRVSGLVGLFAGATAAPGLLVAGAPFGDESVYPLAIAASVPFWLLLGFVAAWRATRRPIASWADYSRELLYLTLAVGLGVTIALLVSAQVVGESLVL